VQLRTVVDANTLKPLFGYLPIIQNRIFGMNFQNAAGVSTVPLMTNSHGYAYFWLMCIASVVIFLYYLKYKKRWI